MYLKLPMVEYNTCNIKLHVLRAAGSEKNNLIKNISPGS